MKFLVLALLAAALVFGVRCMTIRKDLVSERQTIGTEWEQVNAALERRAAVIPDLTQTVHADLPADASAEAAIVRVNDARNMLKAAPSQHEKIQANARLDEALARMMLLVEAYPKLESSKKYAHLLEALRGAEFQIAVARRKYNEAVEHYNARIEVFPTNIVSSVSHLGKIDAYFQTPAP
jgi:LemA protein